MTSRLGEIPIRYDDLACTVYLAGVPPLAGAELPTLYGSSFSVAEYFRIYDEVHAFCACILDQPRHIVAFTHAGSSAVILNQLFNIDAASFRRVCGAIFRSLPRVRRIRFNGSRLDPVPLGLPTRIVAHSEDFVLALPGDYDTYVATLGSATRKNLRKHTRRFDAAFPERRILVYERSEIPRVLVHTIVELNRKRMTSKGEVSLLTPEAEARIQEFGSFYGFCLAFAVGDKIIAGTLGTLVGHDYFGEVQTFDPDFAEYHLGTLCTLQTMRECMGREVQRYHMLWGRNEQKNRLGGQPQALCAFVAYRTAASRIAHVDDVVRVWSWRWRRSVWARRMRAVRARVGGLGKRFRSA